VAIGVVVAYLQTKQQIKQAAELHAEQLTSTLRPVINLVHLESGLDNYGGGNVLIRMEMWGQNVGPGPALQVEFTGWVRIPKAPPFDKARPQEIDEIKAQIDRVNPEFRMRLGAIGPNQGRRIELAPLLGIGVPVADYAAQAGIMVYFFTYEDVFENERPSKPQEQWVLGHETINPRGTADKLRL